MNIRFLKIIFINIFIMSIFSVLPLVVCAGETSVKDLEQLDFANGLFQRDLYDMASTEYKKFIKTFPKSQYLADAYFGIAEGAFFLKDYTKAIEGYSQYLELFPDGKKLDMVTLRLGQTLFLIGKYNEALLNLSEVSADKLEGEFVQILYFYMGKSYREKKNYKLALEFFEKSGTYVKKNQRTARSFLEIAEIYAIEKKYSEAIAYYARVYAFSKSKKMKGFALYKQGEMQFALKDYTSAVETFKSVIKKYPKESVKKEALSNLVLALFNTSKYEVVIEIFQNNQKFIQKNSSFFDIFFVTASTYFQLNKYIESIDLLNQILSFPDLNAENKQKVLIKKAEVFVKAHRFQNAIDLITKDLSNIAIKKDQMAFLKAESFYGLGKFAEAYDAYKSIVYRSSDSIYMLDALYGAAHSQNARGKSQEAMSLFAEYFQKGKDREKREEALFNAVLIGKKLGVSEEAIGYCQIFLTDFPESKRNEKISFWLGVLYADEKQYDKAIKTLQNFIAKYPDSIKQQEAYFLIAYNLQLVSSFEDALKYYQKINIGNKDKKVQYSALKNIALILFQQKKDEKAAEVVDEILMKFPNQDLDIKVVLWLAQKYLEEGKFKDVLRILKGVNLDKLDLNNQEVLAYFLAQSYKEVLDYPNAIQYYDKVLKIDGTNFYDGSAHIGKGLCLIKVKDFGSAQAEFEKAILENAEDNTITMRARFELANMLKVNGKLEEAAKLYMLVGVLYSDDYYTPEALFQAAKIFEKLKRPQDAQKIFKEIIQDYPDSQSAKHIVNTPNE